MELLRWFHFGLYFFWVLGRMIGLTGYENNWNEISILLPSAFLDNVSTITPKEEESNEILIFTNYIPRISSHNFTFKWSFEMTEI